MKKLCKADYDYIILDDLLIITDLNYGNMSVTNDIECVLEDIRRQRGVKLSNYKVCYQDSMGYFDSLIIDKETENFINFNCIRAKNITELKEKI